MEQIFQFPQTVVLVPVDLMTPVGLMVQVVLVVQGNLMVQMVLVVLVNLMVQVVLVVQEAATKVCEQLENDSPEK